MLEGMINEEADELLPVPRSAVNDFVRVRHCGREWVVGQVVASREWVRARVRWPGRGCGAAQLACRAGCGQSN